MKKLLTILSVFIIFSAKGQNFEWVKKYALGSGNSTSYNTCARDSAGFFYITFSFTGTITIDPISNTQITSTNNNGNEDFVVMKTSPNGNLIWYNVFGGKGKDIPYAIKLDNNNNILITGIYSDTVDFDPGPNTSLLTTYGPLLNNDVFTLKLANNGSLIWVRQITKGQSGYNDAGLGIAVDKGNNIYTTGFYSSINDFDSGAGTYNITSNGQRDIFLQKMNSNGDFISAFGIGGTYDDEATSVYIDDSSNIYLAGRVGGATDFDPGSGTHFIFANVITYGGFLLKLDSSFNYKWALVHQGGNAAVKDIAIDHQGDIILAGYFTNTVDFDPGPDTNNITASPNGTDMFVQKLDASGSHLWTHALGGSGFGTEMFHSIAIDGSNNIYLGGTLSANIDVDPGVGIYMVLSKGGFIQKLKPDGSLIWAKTLATDVGYSNAKNIILDNEENLYISGDFLQAVDFNPNQGQAYLNSPLSYNQFLTKWSQDSCSGLYIQYDSLKTVSCSDSGVVYLHAADGAAPYLYSFNNMPYSSDNFARFATGGFHTINVTDSFGCQQNSTVYLDGALYQTDIDLGGELIRSGSIRPGRTAHLFFDIYNMGCMSSPGEVKLVFDTTKMFLDTSGIVPSYISQDTIVWNFSQITYDSTHFNNFIDFSLYTNANTDACFDFIVFPTQNDIDSTNNIKHYCFPIVNSYDPNNKLVYPAGACDEGYILPNQKLTYTINFQNTGNAPAIDIFLIDTISPNLDLNTLRVVSTSHEPNYTELLPNNTLKFSFPNIYLPDSASNEAGSKGYIVYEIYPQPILPEGTTINNYAGIYFDFNEPIYTNAVRNTILSQIPVCLVASNASNEINSTLQAKAYPNPTTGQVYIELSKPEVSQIKIYNNLGQLLKQSSYPSQNLINIDLPEATGLYFIHLQNEQGQKAILKVVRIE